MRSAGELGALVVMLLPASSVAHDQWLEVARGKDGVEARLFLGDGKTIDELPRKPERIARFEIVTGDDVAPLTGDAGAKPAGRAGAVPVLLAVYESKPARLELPVKDFRAYLAEDAVTAPATLDLSPSRRAPISEVYQRCLVVAAGAGHRAGCAFELILRSSSPLEVEVSLRGAPVAKQVVQLKDRDGHVLESQPSGSDGVVRFSTAAPAGFRVTAISMQRARRSDVESFWAALTAAP